MNNNFLFHSLRKVNISTRLILGFTFIFICFLLFFSWTSYQNAYKLINKKINDDLLNHTLLIKKNISSTAEATIKNYLRSKTEFVYQYVEEQHKRYLAGELSEIEAQNKVFDLIRYRSIADDGYHYIIDSNGIVLQHIDPELIGTNIKHFGHIRNQISKKTGYVEYQWRNDGELENREKSLDMNYFEPWDWIISSSAYKDDVLELINIDDFSAVISSIKFGKTGYTYILDNKANFIYHPFLKGSAFEHAKDRSPNNDFFNKIIEGREGLVSYLWKNPEDEEYRSKIAVFSYIDKFRWRVVSSTYPEEFYEPLSKLKSYYLGLVFIALLVSIPIVMYFSYSIVVPIQNVIEGIIKAEKEGNKVRIRLDGYSNDEVAILARSFNSFLKKAEKSTDKLHEQISKIQKSETNQIRLNSILNEKNIELKSEIENKNIDLNIANQKIDSINSKIFDTNKVYITGQLAEGITQEIRSNMTNLSSSLSSNSKTINYLIHEYKNMTLTNEQLEQSIRKLSDSNLNLCEKIDETLNLTQKVEAISDYYSFNNSKSFNIIKITHSLKESVRLLLESKFITLNINSDSDSQLTFENKPEYFNSIFYNLILNSIKLKEHKEYRSEINISLYEKEDNINLIFTDNSFNRRSYDYESLFKQFEATINNGLLSTNLELNVVYDSVVNKLKGKVKFISDKDTGITIKIELPK